MVVLETSDNEQFTVDKDVAERSTLIKQMLEGEFRGVWMDRIGSCSQVFGMASTDILIPFVPTQTSVIRTWQSLFQTLRQTFSRR